jgi:hypothetical protein
MSEPSGGSLTFMDYAPNHPMGFVFAYNCEAQQGETFRNWFVPADASSTSKYPTLVGCLDLGLIWFSNGLSGARALYPEARMKTYCEVFPASEQDSSPVKTIGDKTETIDQILVWTNGHCQNSMGSSVK